MNTAKKTSSALIPQRGSLVALKKGIHSSTKLAVVVSNDIQNEVSDYYLVVPLEKRTSRLKAPFSVDLGRSEGLRDLHTARCDWVTRISSKELTKIERASFSKPTIEKLDLALKVALGFKHYI